MSLKADWFEKGLCFKGYYKENSSNILSKEIKCVNCKSVENIIDSIGDMESMYLYRSLDKYEVEHVKGDYNFIPYIANNTLYESDNTPYISKGYFEALGIDWYKVSYHQIIDTILDRILITENNNEYENKKLYSYSKNFLIPLYRYCSLYKYGEKKEKDYSPMIAVRKMDVNSFNLTYSCNIYRHIGDEGVGAYDSYEKEITIPIKYIMSLDTANTIKNYLSSSKKKHSWVEALSFFIEDLYEDEKLNLSSADLDSIENIRITSFTLDISNFKRKVIEEYFSKCSSKGIMFKKVAGYRVDEEVVSSEVGCVIDDRYDFIIKSKNTIALLQVIIFSLIFIKVYKISKENKNIIENIVETLKKRLNVFEYNKLSPIIENAEKNYIEGFKFISVVSDVGYCCYNIDYYKEILKRICISNELVEEVVSYLKEDTTGYLSALEDIYHWGYYVAIRRGLA